MSKLVVFMNLTLDGVMQAPGRPDEDTRGGFEHGGWAAPRGDAAGEVSAALAKAPDCCSVDERTRTSSPTGPGRRITRTPRCSTPARSMSRRPRCRSRCRGATRSCSAAMSRRPWPGSSSSRATISWSSAAASWFRALMRHDLVDEYVLLIHPLVLGTGRQLFADGSPATELRLVDTRTASNGVLIAIYRPAGAPV